MEVIVNGVVVTIHDDNVLRIPTRWMFELSGEDFHRLCLLRWRYTFFADLALKNDPNADLTKVFHESQSSLCTLFGLKPTSRTAVSALIGRLEEKGFIKVIREKSYVAGFGPRMTNYIQVVDEGIEKVYEDRRNKLTGVE
jgi:hypothetical protein